jgi:hypothetical protein
VTLAECAACATTQSSLIEETPHNNKEYEDEDEEDDDDDDDGHSSVLSTHSLSFKIRQVALHTPPTKNHPFSSSLHSDSPCPTPKSRIHRSTAASTTTSTLLTSLRGGAAAAAVSASSEYTKQLIVAALVTLLYEGSLGHGLEFLKIVMQTAPPGTTYTQVISNITAQKGLAGIWDGFIPWGVIQALAKGSVFGFAHALAMTMITTSSFSKQLPSLYQQTLAGGIAGGVQGYVLSPTLLLKTRVMTHPIFRQPMSLWNTTWISLQMGGEIVHSEGLGVLMKGSHIFAFKRVLDWSTRFFFSDWMEQLLILYKQSSKLTSGDTFVASLLGGALSTIVTLPLDVIVANTQDAKKAGVNVSPLEFFFKDYKVGGWKGSL